MSLVRFVVHKKRINNMTENFIAFIIWSIIGVIFVVMGIYILCSKKEKPFGK